MEGLNMKPLHKDYKGRFTGEGVANFRHVVLAKPGLRWNSVGCQTSNYWVVGWALNDGFIQFLNKSDLNHLIMNSTGNGFSHDCDEVYAYEIRDARQIWDWLVSQGFIPQEETPND